MRVSFALTYSTMTRNIDQDQADINQLSQEVSTGTRLQEPQDDPWAWSQALLMKQNIRESKTFQNNMTFAQNANQATENALDQLSDLLVQTKQLAIGSISANSQQSLAAQSDSMKQILQQAGNLMNTQYNGFYVFGGSATQTPPFKTGNDPTATDYLQYQDSTDPSAQTPVEVRIGKELMAQANLGYDNSYSPSQPPFTFADPNNPGHYTTVQSVLKQVQAAIQQGNTSQISNLLTSIDAASNQVAQYQAQVGTRLSSLQTQSSTLQDVTVNQQTALSDAQDTDMAKVITQLQQKQTTFQAALQVTAMVGKLSLTQYL